MYSEEIRKELLDKLNEMQEKASHYQLEKKLDISYSKKILSYKRCEFIELGRKQDERVSKIFGDPMSDYHQRKFERKYDELLKKIMKIDVDKLIEREKAKQSKKKGYRLSVKGEKIYTDHLTALYDGYMEYMESTKDKTYAGDIHKK